MSAAEFRRWAAFYRLHPFDDEERIFRPAAMVAATNGGADVNELLKWLRREAPSKTFTAADLATMEAFGMKRPEG